MGTDKISFLKKALITAIAITISPQNIMAWESPHVLYNQLEINAIKSRINNTEEPLSSHYQLIKNRAQDASKNADVYQGNDPKYFREKLDLDGPTMYYHAILYALDNREEDALVARDLLVDWANRSLKTVNNYDDFSDQSNNKAAAAMFLGRAMFQIIPTYDLIYNSAALSSQDKIAIENWLRKIAHLIKQGMEYWFDSNNINPCHQYSNHVTADLTGLVLIGYMLNDDTLVNAAISGDTLPTNWKKILEKTIYIAGDPVIGCDSAVNLPTHTGEIVDRYRHIDHVGSDPLLELNRGLGYSILSTYNLSLAAEASYQHGIDLYSFTANTGENLILPAIYYSYYLQTFGPDNSLITSTNYPGSQGYTNEMMKTGYLGAFELLALRYANNQDIVKAFEKYDLNRRPYFLDSLFGKIYTPNLITWDFFVDNNVESWGVPTNITQNGTLQITTRDSNTSLISPKLKINANDFPYFSIKMKASGGGNSDGTISWGTGKSVTFPVILDGEFHEYEIALKDYEAWSDEITQIQLYPTNRINSTVVIDWIRLSSQNPSQQNPPQNGDFIIDGIVDIFDYNEVISKFGNPYTIFDYNLVISNYGN